ncbi:M20 family metallopeptidase [Geomicrobium sp. JCM 19038]|uniref:M20 metallopeptidase family protein n=1 Tax=Geomicrobium sp. JCM 19038 TaxID=1460635 RepID=UPI00045F2D8A|nr:M20 family metallopeptidase [Geomicrobium sp. JCM 19038]GAK06996.1 N-acetyl-L,L-diaminopimelate deacetylase [Geomicrobium sp. JCM 19038]
MTLKRANELLPWLTAIRRDFHEHPELSTQEFRTMDRICHYLDELAIPYEKGIFNTGVVATIQGAKEHPVVALRADMDALPIHEQNDVPYRSKNDGVMHACGHDAHMTVQLGAAKLLQDERNHLNGTIKLLFQPAEETVGGALPMIEEGALENVDGIFGLHVAPEIPVGNVGVRYGQMNAASDAFYITIHGNSSHAAYPSSSVDAIVVASYVITALQTIVSRNVDARDSAVLSFGMIQGGNARNVIADSVTFEGTLRTLLPETRDYVVSRIKETVEHVAKGFGASATINHEPGYRALINDDTMIDHVKKSVTTLLGNDYLQKIEKPSLGVEDFAFFAAEVPGAFYRLGVRNDTRGIIHGGHTNRFDVDEAALAIGAAIQVEAVRQFLND